MPKYVIWQSNQYDKAAKKLNYRNGGTISKIRFSAIEPEGITPLGSYSNMFTDWTIFGKINSDCTNFGDLAKFLDGRLQFDRDK